MAQGARGNQLDHSGRERWVEMTFARCRRLETWASRQCSEVAREASSVATWVAS